MESALIRSPLNLNLYFSAEQPWLHLFKQKKTNQLYPIHILDYIYAVPYSPTIIVENKRVSYQISLKSHNILKDIRTYDLVDLGSQPVEIHLLESERSKKHYTKFNIDGDCMGWETYL
jgi:hypothetical protein